MVLKGGDILRQRRGVRVVLLALLHSLGGKPGDGVPSDVVVFKRGVELRDEVGESSKGKHCSRDGALAKGHCPGKGKPFSHVREGESDLLVIVVIDRLVDKEIKLHSVQPMLRLLIRSVEHFGGANA